jgi:bifunctional non-homologous end joining protein LigD
MDAHESNSSITKSGVGVGGSKGKIQELFHNEGADAAWVLGLRLGVRPSTLDHACRLGLEGIVSKRLDAPYRSGPSKTWLKSKNPLSEAVRREHEEYWS